MLMEGHAGRWAQDALRKPAHITGITIQDGSYPVDFLLDEGTRSTDSSAAPSSCNAQRLDHRFGFEYEFGIPVSVED